MDITFVMIRHVTKQLENSDKIWKCCYNSIRRFYKNKIIIIDNNSDYSIIENDIELVNCEVIRCNYYNSRLYSPFCQLLDIDFERAIIIHDGVIFQKMVDFTKFENVKFIWHFDTKQWDDIEIINHQLNSLSNNNNLIDRFNKKQFVGCMGCCLAITKDFLTKLEDTFMISKLKNIINNQNDAIAFERTIAILCFTLYPGLINDISFEDEIKHMVWGYRYNDYVNGIKKSNCSNVEVTNKSIIKIFGARK